MCTWPRDQLGARAASAGEASRSRSSSSGGRGRPPSRHGAAPGEVQEPVERTGGGIPAAPGKARAGREDPADTPPPASPARGAGARLGPATRPPPGRTSPARGACARGHRSGAASPVPSGWIVPSSWTLSWQELRSGTGSGRGRLWLAGSGVGVNIGGGAAGAAATACKVRGACPAPCLAVSQPESPFPSIPCEGCRGGTLGHLEDQLLEGPNDLRLPFEEESRTRLFSPSSALRGCRCGAQVDLDLEGAGSTPCSAGNFPG